MTLFVNQKVVCISDEGLEKHFYPGTILPVKDQVYTIRELLERGGYPLLLLVEIKNYEYDFESGIFEPAFHRARFRPLVDQPTDITVFTNMLTPSDALEDA